MRARLCPYPNTMPCHDANDVLLTIYVLNLVNKWPSSKFSSKAKSVPDWSLSKLSNTHEEAGLSSVSGSVYCDAP